MEDSMMINGINVNREDYVKLQREILKAIKKSLPKKAFNYKIVSSILTDAQNLISNVKCKLPDYL